LLLLAFSGFRGVYIYRVEESVFLSHYSMTWDRGERLNIFPPPSCYPYSMICELGASSFPRAMSPVL
jgi:hypothetical protein